MKNLTSLFLLFSTGLAAQSYQLLDASSANVTGTTVTVNVAASSSATVNFTAKNTSSASKTTRACRVELSVLAGSDNAFAFDVNQYPPSVDSSAQSISLPPAGGTNLDAFYFPNGYSGTSTISYCVFDAQNMSDNSCVTVIYNSSPTAVPVIATPYSSFGLYPSPAQGEVFLHCVMDKELLAKAELQFFSATGALVKTISAGNLQNEQLIPLTGFSAGLYYYTLTIDGQNLLSRKLAVIN